jgi:hypothetical protein
MHFLHRQFHEGIVEDEIWLLGWILGLLDDDNGDG